jgi:hypothetical protein
MTAITARAPGTSRDAVTTAKGVTSTAATPSEKRVVVLGGPPFGRSKALEKKKWKGRPEPLLGARPRFERLF